MVSSKKQNTPKDRTKTIVFETVKVATTKTLIQLTLEDERILYTTVHSQVSQLVHEGWDESFHVQLQEPFVGKIFIKDSLEVARDYLRDIARITSGVNDSKNPTHAFVGKVVSAFIVKTEPDEELFDKAVVVDKKD